MQRYGPRNNKQKHIIKNIIETGNPFGETGSRLENVPEALVLYESGKKHDDERKLLHLGCMLGYRLNSMRDDVIYILNKLNVDYEMREDEACCGYFIWNTGERDALKDIITQNDSIFSQYDKIICACAGCYTFFKQEYPHSEKFIHVIEILDEELDKLDNNTLKDLQEKFNSVKKISFHDSCHLTRPHGIVDPPRNILEILGYNFEEFDMAGSDGVCCGADGGMRIVNPELAIKIGKKRVEEAKNISDELLTLCPFCIFNFIEASQGDLAVGSLYHEIVRFLNPTGD